MARHVLVVDDDLVNRKLARALLEREGWRVSECEDGACALALAEEEDVQAVLLDISLPDMTGDAVCALLRRRRRGLFIVAYTAHTLEQDTQRMLASGFDRVLLKPVTISAMREAFAGAQLPS